jgi:hypothetical protein
MGTISVMSIQFFRLYFPMCGAHSGVASAFCRMPRWNIGGERIGIILRGNASGGGGRLTD